LSAEQAIFIISVMGYSYLIILVIFIHLKVFIFMVGFAIMLLHWMKITVLIFIIMIKAF